MTKENKAANAFPLRLPRTMRREITGLARHEGMSVNQFITIAVAEKMARLELENPHPAKHPIAPPPQEIKPN
jgi:hypothetical protein